MRTFYHSYLSPYARRVLIVLAEKGLEQERKKYKFAREFDGLAAIDPCLLLAADSPAGVRMFPQNLAFTTLFFARCRKPRDLVW